tara:strand:+ start:5805 stop:7457 length:1653 start_codon:yes stop_codon:yes gene_type:complete
MATTPPPNNSKPVWFNPRDDSGDKVLYYLRDGRSSKHAGLKPLTPHPLAASNPIYEGLVFLNRTPADDQEAGLVKDWYGPSSLVDDILSVREVGGGYESTLLYARGTTPPDEDTRIDVLGRQTLSDIGPVSVAWVNDPLTSAPGIDLALITGVSTLEGDEVYIVISTGDMKDLEPIFGLNVRSKRLKIVRHISSTSVHVEIPYNSSVDLSAVDVAADVYDAHYLLDGYTDAETAPGVLSGLFHTRTFSYRLAEPSYTSEWDDSLGLEILTEKRLLPYSVSRLVDGTPTALATEEKQTSYEMVSRNLTMRTLRKVITGAGPTQDGMTWSSRTRITVPAICTGTSVPYCWGYASAADDEGDVRQSYSEAWAITKTTINAHEEGVATRIVRRVVLEGSVKDLADSLGLPFAFQTSTYSFGVKSAFAFSGANVGTGAGVRTASIGPCLLGGKHNGKMKIRALAMTHEDYLAAGGEGSSAKSGAKGTLNPGESVWIRGQSVPWGSEVIWDVKPQKARWGYWMVDITYVTLPVNPSALGSRMPRMKGGGSWLSDVV